MEAKRKSVSELLRLLDVAYPDARCELEHEDPYQLIVATILSAQCTDARVNLTTPALFAKYPDAKSLAKAKLPELESLIRSTGFYHNKARNLIGMALALTEHHGGRVPGDRDSLAALPGVGPKTANVVLANAFGVPALAVDTHIFRVARRLGLSEAPTPEKVGEDLMARFPQELWIPLHHQLIWHGRRVCEARKPRCEACALRAMCPTGSGDMVDPHTGQPVAAAGEPLARPSNPPSSHARAPKRILSLVPSITELLATWGLGNRLVGRTRYCTEPAYLCKSLPEVGGTKDPDVAKILALHPDLVIMEKDENSRETARALDGAGLSTLVLEIRTLKDCLRVYRELSRILGVPRKGEAAAKALERKLDRIPQPQIPALALVWKNPWMSAGKGTYLADLARHGGFRVLGPAHYSKLMEKDLKTMTPRIVLLPTDPYPFSVKDEAALKRAFPKAEIRILDGKAITWFLSRTEKGLAQLRALHEELG